ncbi:polysaccharide pyruvyl transferase family protein [Janibacter terrae]|uniref:polysaccharide pyruvyl transferase family protein n=1 Tax=Janibacter terrae TaxID=103817 RepID=UPI0038163EFD|nr:hypothetical protein [Kytococcus sp.]
MTHVRQVGLVGGVGGGNTGNEVSLAVVHDQLAAARPDLRFAVVTPMPDGARARGVVHGDEPVLSFRADRTRGGARAVRLGRRVVAELRHVGSVLGWMGSLEAVVVCGTGVLDDLEEPPWGMPWSLFLWAAAARARRRPFVLLAVGAGPIGSRASALLFRATVRLASEVTYRDADSLRTMADLGAARPDARVTCDLAFGRAVGSVAPAQPGPGMRVAVGIMDWRGWSGSGRGTEQYLDILAEVVVGLLDRGCRVVLTVGQPVDVEPAREVRRRVLGERPQARLPLSDVGSFDELVEVVQGVDLVVATRFHTVVAALAADRAIVSAGYAPKNRAVLERVGLDHADRPVDEIDAAWILGEVDAVAEGRAPWRADRQIIAGWARLVRDEIDGLATRIDRATSQQRRVVGRVTPTSRWRSRLRRPRAWWSRRGGSRSA